MNHFFSFKNKGKAYFSSDTGVAAIVTAMMLPAMLGLGGLAVDASSWFMYQRDLQTAADAAALAGAYELANGDEGAVEDAALKEARNNGFTGGADELDLEVTQGDEGMRYVSVSLREPVQLWFSQIFVESVEIAASAEAEMNEENDGSACILSLDESEDHALRTSGNVTIDMPNCGMAVNSDSDEALYMNGSVDIDVGDVRVHGDYETVGAVEFEYESMRTNAPPTEDPYADLDVPSFSACSSNQKRNGTRVNSTTTLRPGVFCGGINITGNNTVTFEPGVYILDGGSFNVSGNGALIGEGVTFVLTNSPGSGAYGNVDITGGRTVTFSAPGAGEDMEGVVFYQDRDAPTSGTNRIAGTADIQLDGAAYFPSQEFTIGGNTSAASASNPCSRVIARTVVLHGNPHLSNSCDGSAARTIAMPGSSTIRLSN